MVWDFQTLERISSAFGNAFYLLDVEQFAQNYRELELAFRSVYANSAIAYSYKTNYIPRLCEEVNALGGYAEIVSDMEYEIAKRVGVRPEKIIFNGPYKSAAAVEELLLGGGTVNLDAAEEIDPVAVLAEKHPECVLHIGVRCNFPINDGVLSRFGFDIDSEEFERALALVRLPNVRLRELHCHFSTRSLETWRPRAAGMLDLLDRYRITPEQIDLGGGLFGKMPESLKAQFSSCIPSYEEYALEAASLFAERFTGDYRPKLLIEPGSALCGDVMKFVARVESVKQIRGKNIATVCGSVYNINPTLNGKNPPLEIVSGIKNEEILADADLAGYTCIESDYLYKHYDGPLSVGDFAVFGNVGSYSIVLKPPFILPNFPILELLGGGVMNITKRAETFEDLFRSYSFELGDRQL